ncbi:MAG: HAMP domain-containing protein, partial [Halobacteriota archaeon]
MGKDMKLGDIKIGTRLFAGFAVVLVLTAALGIVALINIGTMQEQTEMMDKAADAQAGMITVRQQEKNYIMREDQASIDNVAEALTGVKNAAAAAAAAAAADMAIVDQITTPIPVYESAFAELQRFTNSKNEFLASVEQDGRDIESAIKASSADQATKDALIIQLLTLRRAEKNFVLREDDQSVTQVSDGINGMKADVDAAAMTGADKSAIKTAADTYQKDFSAIVSTVADVNELQSTDGPLVESARGLTAAAATLYENAEARAAKAAETATMYILAFIIAAIGSGLGIAFFVTKSITKPINQLVDDADELAKGNMSHEVTVSENKDELGTLTTAFSRVAGAIQKFAGELGVLNKAAAEGKLDTRGDPEKFEGDFAKLVAGVNSTLDGVIGPLNVAAEYVDRISKGDIPEEITDEYKGDFNEIKNNLNGAIKAINGLVSEAGMLAEAAVEGKLDTRGDVGKFSGDFANIVQGVNETLDGVIGPLNVAAEYVDRISKGDIPEEITDEYKGDFNEIKNNLNQAIKAINGLVAEAGMLNKAAVEGK